MGKTQKICIFTIINSNYWFCKKSLFNKISSKLLFI